MAMGENVLNANAPSLGKTIETIAAIFEADDDHHHGAHLILAPITSLDVVWEFELSRWQPYKVIVAKGSRHDREMAVLEALRLNRLGKPFFLVANPSMVTMAKRCSTLPKARRYRLEDHRYR